MILTSLFTDLTIRQLYETNICLPQELSPVSLTADPHCAMLAHSLFSVVEALVPSLQFPAVKISFMKYDCCI